MNAAPGDADDLLVQAYKDVANVEARERFVERFSGLVFSVVNKFRSRCEWEDLVQVGYLGLIKAAEAYDPSQRVKFTTYAYHCILGEVTHFIRDRKELVRRPRWHVGLSRQVGQFIEIYSQTYSRLPTVEQIATKLNLTHEAVEEVLKSRSHVSLDSSPGPEFDIEKIRSGKYETFKLPLEDRIAIQQALDKLVAVEKDLIFLFFYRDLSQGQISKATGLSPKKVSRVIQKALGHMRDFLGLSDPSQTVEE
jgi:RNA polymerase sigma-B factor